MAGSARAQGALRAAGEAAVVPALAQAFCGVDALTRQPAVHAVFRQGGAGLGVADARLGVVGEGAVVVGDDQRVLAQRLALLLGVFEPAEQAFFDQQALQEGEIAFLVLHGHPALRVDGRIGQVPTPGRHQLAAAVPVAEEFIDDLDDALVLEQVVVDVVVEEGEPGFDAQPVAGKAAVGAEPFDAADVAVEGPVCGARQRGLQFQPRRLPLQRGQRLVGVGGEHGEVDAKAGVAGHRPERFVDVRRLRQQGVGAGRGGQRQQAVGLPPARRAADQVEEPVHDARLYLKLPFFAALTRIRPIAVPSAMRVSTASAISGSSVPLRM